MPQQVILCKVWLTPIQIITLKFLVTIYKCCFSKRAMPKIKTTFIMRASYNVVLRKCCFLITAENDEITANRT